MSEAQGDFRAHVGNSKDVVHIGNPRGKIAIWCDDSEALDIAYSYSPQDRFYQEIMDAVVKAYPPSEQEEERP